MLIFKYLKVRRFKVFFQNKPKILIRMIINIITTEKVWTTTTFRRVYRNTIVSQLCLTSYIIVSQRDKSEFLTRFVGIIATIIFI